MSSTTISPNSPTAWGLSLSLHALAIGLIAIFAYTAKLTEEKPPRIIELVAGPGDDYGAKEAPALGTEAGVKLDLSKLAPAPMPTPPAPIPPAPTPPRVVDRTPEVAPTPKTPPKTEAKTPPKAKEPDPTKDIAKELKNNVRSADRWARKEAAVERKKEEARVAKITKEQFDKMNAGKVSSATAPKGTAPKVAKIDAKGIAQGVLGGSADSKTGAGGKALKREDGSVLELYDAELLLKLRKAFEEDRPPGLSDALKVTIAVRSNPDGSLTGAKVVEPSGNPEFDRAVLDALRRVKKPARPDKKADYLSFVFTMREG